MEKRNIDSVHLALGLLYNIMLEQPAIFKRGLFVGLFFCIIFRGPIHKKIYNNFYPKFLVK